MSEMIERVARAIFETWAADGNSDVTWAELLKMRDGDGYQEGKRMYALAIKEARAAIEAMREPTKPMVDAAVRDTLEGPGISAFRNWPDREAYRYGLMIDAALSEAQSTGEKK
jgi:hypothetical protein